MRSRPRRGDRRAGQHQLQRLALADEPRQPLRAGVAGDQAEIDFRLSELRGVGGEPQRAGHRQLAAAAERVAVDRGDDRLAEVLDEIEDVLPGSACSRAAVGVCAASSLMSAPATNDFSPAPVRMTARTVSSRLQIENGAAQLVERLAFSALRTFGRLIVTIATPPSRSHVRRFVSTVSSIAD